MFHPALNHGAPDFRMPVNLVPDHDQPQGIESRMSGQLLARDGESLHQPRDVFLRADVPDVEQKRIVDLVPLQDAALLQHGVPGPAARESAGRVRVRETGVRRVVDRADPPVRNARLNSPGPAAWPKKPR